MFRDMILSLTPDLIGKLYFRTGINLVRTRQGPILAEDLRRICVFSTAGIGNLVLLTPMLYQLRTKLPQAKIDLVVVSEAAAGLLSGTDLVDTVWVQGRGKHYWRTLRAEWYDLAIAATHRGFMRAKNAFRTGARYRIGFRYPYADHLDADFLLTHSVAYREETHEAILGMELLTPLGISGQTELRLPLSLEETSKAAELLAGNEAGWVAFHSIAGNEPRKAWPLEYYSTLAARLHAHTQWGIVLVGGPEERSESEKLARSIGAICLAGELTLRETAAVLRECRLFVGHDGGPMHLAAAVGTPVIALFGPTDPRIYGPWGEGHRILQSEKECVPCHRPHSGKFDCDSNACMHAISVDAVWKLIERNGGMQRKEIAHAKNGGLWTLFP